VTIYTRSQGWSGRGGVVYITIERVFRKVFTGNYSQIRNVIQKSTFGCRTMQSGGTRDASSSENSGPVCFTSKHKRQERTEMPYGAGSHTNACYRSRDAEASRLSQVGAASC
jgi:hypothetical protein